MKYNANGEIDFVILENKQPFHHNDEVTQNGTVYKVYVIFYECLLTTADGTQINALKFFSTQLSSPAPFVEAQIIPRQNCLGHAFFLDYFIDIRHATALLAGEGYKEVPTRPAGDHLVLYYNNSNQPIHIGRYHANEGLYFHKKGINAPFVDDAHQGQHVMRNYPDIASLVFFQKAI